MLKRITNELWEHAPFTVLGATTGIIIMVIIVLSDTLPQVFHISYPVFYVLHPAHVVLSAIVTTVMYKKYGSGKIWISILVGYTGSVGIATLSDSIIPYLGEILLDLPGREMHIGFIEEWWVVNPAALLGIIIGYWKSATKFPHSGHVLISTWASLFHIILALGTTVNWITILAIFFFLFVGVWIPCCLSDIIFPLLFTNKFAYPEHNHL
ncbi:MAG: hypothetical protein PHQ86_02255 [Dehalococcoidales bacterium]|nr:hypothetical protein [Dehalococcoidales bacterium]